MIAIYGSLFALLLIRHAMALGYLSEEEFDELLRPEKMVGPS